MDIDEFLSRKKTKEEKTPEKEKNIDLSFQKDVEDKLVSTQERAKNADFKFLKTIYDEVKRFDEDLPHKFLGLEQKGGSALKSIGEFYSSEYYKKLKSKKEYDSKDFLNKLAALGTMIEQKKYVKIPRAIEALKQQLSGFPKEFFLEKIAFERQLCEKELNYHTSIAKDNITLHSDFENTLDIKTSNLKSALRHEVDNEIENSLQDLEKLLRSQPEAFQLAFVKERTYALELIKKGKIFLETIHKKELGTRIEHFGSLVEKFKTYYLKKDLEKALLIYDELIFAFSKLPDIMFEEKMKLYSQLNSLHTQLNQLYVNHHVSTLLESYEHGKVLEEIQEYIFTNEKKKTPNKEHLTILLTKLEKLPPKFTVEKSQLRKVIQKLLGSEGEKYTPQETNFRENLNPKKKVSAHKPLTSSKNHSKVFQEINELFEHFKEAQNKEEVKTLYQKLMFYAKVVPLSKDKKQEMLSRIHSTLQQKRLA